MFASTCSMSSHSIFPLCLSILIHPFRILLFLLLLPITYLPPFHYSPSPTPYRCFLFTLPFLLYPWPSSSLPLFVPFLQHIQCIKMLLSIPLINCTIYPNQYTFQPIKQFVLTCYILQIYINSSYHGHKAVSEKYTKNMLMTLASHDY